MTVPVDIWLRGQHVATSASFSGVAREPKAWTDDDVQVVLEGMLHTMHRLKHPKDASVPPIALRGLSWIVNAYEEGGVVIAIEIAMGAAIAGPFDIERDTLEAMIGRVLERPSSPPSLSIH